ALIEPFSPRFLREFGAFPYETEQGEPRLAVADPSDPAVLRMMELTLERPAVREVAAFDEIETVLRAAVGTAEAATVTEDVGATEPWAAESDDLDSLRDL